MQIAISCFQETWTICILKLVCHYIAQNLMGHDSEARAAGTLGCFHKDWFYLAESQIELIQAAKVQNPEAKYIVLGHSMGSFVARTLASKAGNLLDGLIIMGTAQMPSVIPGFGYKFASAIGTLKGDYYKSKLLDNLALGKYNDAFKPEETGVEWLSRDKEVQKRYIADPLCNYMPTTSMYKGIFQGLNYITKKENINKIPHDLPILLIAGVKDPVGDMGAGVQRLYEIMRGTGFPNLDLRLYPDMRHELLNEIGKEAVYKDLLDWIRQVAV
ncbi:MAG: alpha/beta fold hydrolase [Saccharofermentanales bacterium]